MYRAPKVLRKRKSGAAVSPEGDRVVEADTEATGVELHKDSRFYASWQNFKVGARWGGAIRFIETFAFGVC